MNIQLGNLNLKDVVKNEYLEKVQKFLDENGYKKTNKCDDVEKECGNYHIYDMPRLFVICGEEKMQEFIKFLKEEEIVGKGFIGQIGLTYVDNI